MEIVGRSNNKKDQISGLQASNQLLKLALHTSKSGMASKTKTLICNEKQRYSIFWTFSTYSRLIGATWISPKRQVKCAVQGHNSDRATLWSPVSASSGDSASITFWQTAWETKYYVTLRYPTHNTHSYPSEVGSMIFGVIYIKDWKTKKTVPLSYHKMALKITPFLY